MTDLIDDMEEVSASTLDTGGGSVLDRLRAQREAIGADLDTVIDVPGHNGLLAVRYQLLNSRRAAELGRQLRSEKPEAQLNYAADLLQEACMEVLVRDSETAELKPIDPAHGPTKFDGHLLDLFQITADQGMKLRDVVKLVFNRDFAVMQVANELSEWMARANADANEDFKGK